MIHKNRVFCINSTFIQNFGENGGALDILSYELNICNCLFLENIAFILGGALNIASRYITIQKSEFLRNTATFGGACYFSVDPSSSKLNHIDKSLYFLSTIFYNNVAISMGGAIYTSTGMTFYNTTYTNVYFLKQMAFDAGALCLCDLLGIHTFINCSFLTNIAEYGGGVYIYSNGIFNITNCKFIANTAISIHFYINSFYSLMLYNTFASMTNLSYIYENQSFSINNLYFIDLTPNSSPGQGHYGGALIQDFNENANSAVFLRKTLFKRNMALERGGAILVLTGFNDESDCKFIENYAVRFGGVFDLEDTVESYHNNSVFLRNSAGSS